jgi:hypothetical protein
LTQGNEFMYYVDNYATIRTHVESLLVVSFGLLKSGMKFESKVSRRGQVTELASKWTTDELMAHVGQLLRLTL